MRNETAAVATSRAALGALELWTCPDLSPMNASSLNPSGLLHKLRRREVRDAHKR